MEAKLSDLTSWIFDPILQTRGQIEALLAEKSVGTAHPFSDGLVKLVLLWTGTEIKEIDISDVDPQIFISAANLSEIERKVVEYLNMYPQLTPFKDYAVQAVTPGQIIDLPVTNDIMTFVASDKRNGTYFDFVAYCDDGSTLTYNAKKVGGMIHSGDLAMPRPLLHTIKGFNNVTNDAKIVLAAVGYNETFLRNFVNQLPVVFLVDHDAQIIYTVPCPLDQATIGDATLSGLIVARKYQGRLQCYILPSPTTVEGVNTGDKSATTLAAGNASIPQASVVFQEFDSFDTGTSTSNAHVPVPTTTSNIVKHAIDQPIADYGMIDVPAFTFISSGIDIAHVPVQGMPVFTGAGYSSEPFVDLPIALLGTFGPVINISSCAFGRLPSVPVTKEVLDTTFAITHTTDQIRDSVVPGCTKASNGLMIIHPKMVKSDTISKALAQFDTGDKHNRKSLEQLVNGICVNATCEAGPNAIVVVNLQDRYFWYRGVRVPGLIETVPDYCDEVTESFAPDRIDAWLATDPVSTLVWPLVVSITDNLLVHWNGIMMAIPDALNILGALSLEDLSANTDDLLDLLTQISVIMEASNVKKFRDAVDQVLLKLLDQHVAPYKKKYHEASRALFEGAEGMDRDIVATLRDAFVHEKRHANKLVQRLSNSLENLVSIRGASSMNQNIKRRARATLIYKNVDKANNMTMDGKMELLDKYCATYGLLMANMDRTQLANCLDAVNRKVFNYFIESGAWTSGAFSPNDRTLFLDSNTLGCLLQLTQTQSEHPLYSANTVALPQGHQGPDRHESMMPFPLLDMDVDLDDPSKIVWTDRANEEQCAMWRILMRSTISQCTASRTFNISPASNDLGLFLIHTIMSVMESIVAGMSNVPNPETDWDNTTCQMLRGMFGQLFSLMASSKNILCPAFQFVYRTPKIEVLPVDQWWIVARMARLFPYTCWDTTYMNANIQKYIVKSVRKFITNEPTGKMQKYLTASKKIQHVKSQEWLDFLRLIVDTLFYSADLIVEQSGNGGNDDDKVQPLTPAVAGRLLKYMPTDLSNGTQMMVHYLDKLVKFLIAVVKGDDVDFLRIIDIAIFSYIKHGDDIDGEKHTIKTRVHSCQTLTEYVKLYHELRPDPTAPWGSSKNPNHAINLADIIGGDVVEGDVMNNLKLAIPDPVVFTVPELLAKNPGSGRAVAIANNLSTMTCYDLTSIPSHHFVTLMEVANVPDHDGTLRRIIEMLLMGWRDSVKAERDVLVNVFGLDV